MQVWTLHLDPRGRATPVLAEQRVGEPARLTVVSAAPDGEIANREEANEIRVVFSEPMVVLGRIPARVTASFVRIKPAIPGNFRWSGTTTLIFTPDVKPAAAVGYAI